MAEAENYTSKIAKAQAQELQIKTPKAPSSETKVMTDEKTLNDAILTTNMAQERNMDNDQLVEQEAYNPELRGAAASSFAAAASVGQYTGDLSPGAEAD